MQNVTAKSYQIRIYLVCHKIYDNVVMSNTYCVVFFFLLLVPNSAIKECENYTDLSGKEFLHPSKSGTSRPTLTKEQQEYNTKS
jgi:hypothetical protein